MPDPRPLLLLPPSKGKATGGDGPPYRRTLDVAGPLGAARLRVLDALEQDLADLDDGQVARLGGVGAGKVAFARALLADLTSAPTLPAHRRYTGIVHGNAGLAEIDPQGAGIDVRIVSALLGLAGLGDAVPDYRVEFGATLPSLGGIAPFWRGQLGDHLAELGSGRRVWDLLPAEHRRVWHPDQRTALEVIEVAFLRPDGRPANAARTKVAKGRFAAALLVDPGLTPARAARRIDLGDGWSLAAGDATVTATFTD